MDGKPSHVNTILSELFNICVGSVSLTIQISHQNVAIKAVNPTKHSCLEDQGAVVKYKPPNMEQ